MGVPACPTAPFREDGGIRLSPPVMSLTFRDRVERRFSAANRGPPIHWALAPVHAGKRTSLVARRARAKEVGWASSPVMFGSRDGSFARQPGRLPYRCARREESGMGVLACHVWQPGRLPYWRAQRGESGMGVLACHVWQPGTAASPGSRDGYPTGALGAEKVGWASSPVNVWQPGTAASPGSRDGYPTGAVGAEKVGWASSPVMFGSRDGSFARQPGRLPYWRAQREGSGMGVLACHVWQPGTAASPGSRDGYPTGALSAEKVGWASPPVRFRRPTRPSRRWAAGTAASPGSRDGYPTGALGAEKVGWASSPVNVWQPGTAASPGSRDGYPTGALSAKKVGWASSPVNVWQPGRQLRQAAGTATLLVRSARRKWDGRPRLSARPAPQPYAAAQFPAARRARLRYAGRGRWGRYTCPSLL